MPWGFFSVAHIVSLVGAAGMVVALYFVLKGATQKVQLLVLQILSFSGIAAIVYNLVMWDSPLEYLPLHLCSINALVLPVVVFTRSKTLGNLLLLWSLGALAALVLNVDVADAPIFGDVFCFYYFPHVLEFGIPLLLFKLGLVEKTPRCILPTMGITLAAYTLIHFANLALNAYCAAHNVVNPAGNLVQVNYMFSLVPTNPLLTLFYQIIPYTYWYMLLVFPIALVYLLAVYTPQLWKARKKSAV